MKNPSSLEPSPKLYATVRAGFVRQGISLNRWCIANQIQRQSARKALLGEWRGPTATRLIAQIFTESRANG